MAGGKATPKKDKEMKVSEGQPVKTGHLLARGYAAYKAGINVGGRDPLYALCAGKVHFTKRKVTRNKPRTFINIERIAAK